MCWKAYRDTGESVELSVVQIGHSKRISSDFGENETRVACPWFVGHALVDFGVRTADSERTSDSRLLLRISIDAGKVSAHSRRARGCGGESARRAAPRRRARPRLLQRRKLTVSIENSTFGV